MTSQRDVLPVYFVTGHLGFSPVLEIRRGAYDAAMKRASSTLILAVAGLWLSMTPARAQVCQNDHDPRPATATATACDDRPACPNPSVADDATHFNGGHIVYTPRVVVGACHPGNEGTFSNGCTIANASCIDGQCVVQYAGLIYRPAGTAAKSPAVLLVPGSANCTTIGTSCVYQPEPFCGLKNALLAKGYVVMEVLPRGYGIDATRRSTGYYIDNAVTQQNAMGAPCAANRGACSTYDLLDEGLFDVAAGYQFLANRPFVDASAIAVFGHSLGGVRALAFNREDHGQKATVAIAAASESWCFSDHTDNTILWAEMARSIDLARSATYTFQPQNDVNLESGSVIAHEAAENRWQYQAAFFPPVAQVVGGVLTDLPYGDEAHACFVTNQRNVDEWAPTVINFLRRYGVK